MNSARKKKFSELVLDLINNEEHTVLKAVEIACDIEGIEYQKTKDYLTSQVLSLLHDECVGNNLIRGSQQLPL